MTINLNTRGLIHHSVRPEWVSGVNGVITAYNWYNEVMNQARGLNPQLAQTGVAPVRSTESHRTILANDQVQCLLFILTTTQFKIMKHLHLWHIYPANCFIMFSLWKSLTLSKWSQFHWNQFTPAEELPHLFAKIFASVEVKLKCKWMCGLEF